MSQAEDPGKTLPSATTSATARHEGFVSKVAVKSTLVKRTVKIMLSEDVMRPLEIEWLVQEAQEKTNGEK